MKKIFSQIGGRAPILALGAAVAIAASAAELNHKSKTETPEASVNLTVDENPVTHDGSLRGSYAPVVKKVSPAVVKIVTTTTVRNPATQQIPGMDDPFWRRFFGDQFGQMTPPRQMGPQRERGLGSGVIVTKDGYILTNNHVVDGATEVSVTLQDGREMTAKVIGRDPKSDIAVVKVDATDLPVVTIADSDKVQVGDVVLAIGNPFGVGQTVTEGIVSATGRGNMGIEDYEDFIQTDAAINPGNSGGALVDIEGRLIGVNTAILSRSGGSQGVGFAIPSDLARTVMDSLVKYGKVTRGYLGVMIQDVTPALASEFNLKDSTGALVGDVVPKGPADKAGLESGDVVVDFNGHKITDSRRLKLDVAATKPDSNVPIKIMRNGSVKSMSVNVGELPGSDQVAKTNTENAKDTGTLNGVAVGDVDRQVRRQFNLPETVKGAVVTQVDPSSVAADSGLKPGDVIQEINHRPVKGADDAVKLTENSKNKKTLLRVWSNGGSHYLVVDESNQAG